MKPTNFIQAVLLLGFVLCSTACTKRVGSTTISVQDSLRHYYPVVAGDELNLSYWLMNTGTEPFVLEDIQPSCGCISVEDARKIIPPGDSLHLSFKFNTDKNIGYVHHTVRVFGNVRPMGVVNLVFDVNVVPPAEYTHDYEEDYRERMREQSGDVEELVNGSSSQKGYYVDPSKDSRSHAIYPWRE